MLTGFYLKSVLFIYYYFCFTGLRIVALDGLCKGKPVNKCTTRRSPGALACVECLRCASFAAYVDSAVPLAFIFDVRMCLELFVFDRARGTGFLSMIAKRDYANRSDIASSEGCNFQKHV